ncbi:MAG: hypothetical protein GFH27_549307n213 [Chloroflexi bacterium AL-W]|nr:hypothetical protein [Chloroflexi bacterium AL-N10]NOK77229.1 hypothetical protein [Chloroflexi bacterium AL-N5]NOK83873.1 hypothetical protein [Chloroflexi bacterium AL-W]NOK91084.1 hypothetical protein [Chloroflexi bacterium AL-N15]
MRFLVKFYFTIHSILSAIPTFQNFYILLSLYPFRISIPCSFHRYIRHLQHIDRKKERISTSPTIGNLFYTSLQEQPEYGAVVGFGMERMVWMSSCGASFQKPLGFATEFLYPVLPNIIRKKHHENPLFFYLLALQNIISKQHFNSEISDAP